MSNIKVKFISIVFLLFFSYKVKVFNLNAIFHGMENKENTCKSCFLFNCVQLFADNYDAIYMDFFRSIYRKKFFQGMVERTNNCFFVN